MPKTKVRYDQGNFIDTIKYLVNLIEKEAPQYKQELIAKIGKKRYQKLLHLSTLDDEGVCGHLVNRWIVDQVQAELQDKEPQFFSQFMTVAHINDKNEDFENLTIDQALGTSELQLIEFAQNIAKFDTDLEDLYHNHNIHALSPEIEFLYQHSQVVNFLSLKEMLKTLQPGRKYRIVSDEFTHAIGFTLTTDNKIVIYDPNEKGKNEKNGEKTFDNVHSAAKYILTQYGYDIFSTSGVNDFHFSIQCYSYNNEDSVRLKKLKTILQKIAEFIDGLSDDNNIDPVISEIKRLINQLEIGNLPYENTAKKIAYLVERRSDYFKNCSSVAKLNEYLQQKSEYTQLQLLYGYDSGEISHDKKITTLIEAARFSDYSSVNGFLKQLKGLLQLKFPDNKIKQREILEEYINHRSKVGFGETALMLAITNFNFTMTELLLKNGALITSEAFSKALKNKDIEIIKLLLNHTYKNNIKNIDGYMPVPFQLPIIAKLFGTTPLDVTANTRFNTILQKAFYQKALEFRGKGKLKSMIKVASKAARLGSIKAFKLLLDSQEKVDEKFIIKELQKVRMSYLLRSLSTLKADLESNAQFIKDSVKIHNNHQKIKLLNNLIVAIKNFNGSNSSDVFKECLQLVNTACNKGLIFNTNIIRTEVVKFKELNFEQLYNDLAEKAAPEDNMDASSSSETEDSENFAEDSSSSRHEFGV